MGMALSITSACAFVVAPLCALVRSGGSVRAPVPVHLSVRTELFSFVGVWGACLRVVCGSHVCACGNRVCATDGWVDEHLLRGGEDVAQVIHGQHLQHRVHRLGGAVLAPQPGAAGRPKPCKASRMEGGGRSFAGLGPMQGVGCQNAHNSSATVLA